MYGFWFALSLGVTREDQSKMNETFRTRNLEEPKYFLLWIALWIVAVLALLPALGRA
jgi:hypothetical protein